MHCNPPQELRKSLCWLSIHKKLPPDFLKRRHFPISISALSGQRTRTRFHPSVIFADLARPRARPAHGLRDVGRSRRRAGAVLVYAWRRWMIWLIARVVFASSTRRHGGVMLLLLLLLLSRDILETGRVKLLDHIGRYLGEDFGG